MDTDICRGFASQFVEYQFQTSHALRVKNRSQHLSIGAQLEFGTQGPVMRVQRWHMHVVAERKLC